MGAIVAAIAVGGLLYALYPSGFAANRDDESGNANSSNIAADQYWMGQSNGTTGEEPTLSFAPQIPSVPLPSDGLDY